jgi:hypothetical protein
MHLAKARLKVPESELPWAPSLLLDETFPELLEEPTAGLLVGELADGAALAPQPASRTRLHPAIAARTPCLRGLSSLRRAAGIMGGICIFVTILVSFEQRGHSPPLEAALKYLDVSSSEMAVTRRS